MDKQEILTMLNSLDVQVSMGRIDQPTYDSLKQKWTQLLTAEPDPPVPVTPPAMSSHETGYHAAATEVLACPKCAAPAQLDTTQDLSRPLRCPFCDTVYTLRQGQDNAQQLKKELIAWFDRVVVGSGRASSSVDINARRYIFSDSLYPILKKEVERRMEAFDTVLEAPLIQVKETAGFREYQPASSLLAIAQGDNQWLKTLVSRVTAEQLQNFAVVPDDQYKLQQLQLRLQSLIYHANISQQFASAQVSAYQVIRQNILALQESYQPLLQENDAEQRYRAFIAAQNERAQGALLLVEAMISAFDEQHGIVPERLVSQVSRALAQMEAALHQADTCAYNPLYTVFLQHGIKKDITGARIFQAVVTAYELVTRTQPCEFPAFHRRLLSYVQHLARLQDAEHLLWLLTSISRVLGARAGEAPLPIVKNWQWLERAVVQHRRAGTLGFGGEKGEVKARFFHPYWVARLNYTAVDGRLVRKTNVREGLLLVDATSVDVPQVVALTSEDPQLQVVQAGAQQFALFDKPLASLPALVTHAMAERAMKVYAGQQAARLKVLSTKMIGVVYLPAAVVQYRGKQKQREQVLCPVPVINQALQTYLTGTTDFLRTYRV
ncbi:MAG TPA: hypothetical protein VL485_15980 [Ktedonobacteraceae bacterium]|jgi:hypothetical protein|nr:hypothetical protein [Ktedonobacteraceae bacterium]